MPPKKKNGRKHDGKRPRPSHPWYGKRVHPRRKNPMASEAYAAGVRAGRDGRPGVNPYPSGTDEHSAWQAGYNP